MGIRDAKAVFPGDASRPDSVEEEAEPRYSLKGNPPAPEPVNAVLIMTRRGNTCFISAKAKVWLDDLGMTPASLMKSFRAQEANGAGRFLFLKNHSRQILLTEADSNRKGSVCLILEEIPGPLRSLTPRQLETHYWLSRGKSNDQIAILMQVKVCTVRKHLEKVFEVLGVETRTAAAWFGHYYSFILRNGADDS